MELRIVEYLLVIFLLWGVNFMPPLLAFLLEDRWARSLDLGFHFVDGRPLLGPHKTLRGFLGGTIGGGIAACVLSLSFEDGVIVGFLSMFGDIFTSFLKRRLAWPSGRDIPGLDQFFEGFLPLVFLVPRLGMSAWAIVPLLAVFSLGAYLGSLFYKGVLFRRPFESYPRPLGPKLRLKEFTSCRLAFRPVRYLLHFEEAIFYHVLIRALLRLMGIYARGVANALEVERRTVELAFPNLPPAFDGYRMLFLSDLHLDGLDGLSERLAAIAAREPVDVCILGGDYRMAAHGPYEETLKRLKTLVSVARTRDGIVAVLGNHDCLEMIEPLHDMGVRVLLNESMPVERDGETLWIAGVDDPHYYQCPSLDDAYDGLPSGAFVVLVAHSPELGLDAAGRGTSLYLCGHTHAGQIQLPRIGPIFTHSRSPRRISEGLWRQGGMLGYTSTGAGVSGVPVRFNTRGEVVLFTLCRAVAEPAAANGKGNGNGE